MALGALIFPCSSALGIPVACASRRYPGATTWGRAQGLPQEDVEMKPIWLLVGSAVVVLVLSLALLEIVAERVHFEPLSTASDPGDEAGDRWQDVPATQRAGSWEIADVLEASLPGR
jgi:hypothetical protein